jgi:hypothetical protein
MLVFEGSTMPGVKASFLSGLLATFLMGGAFIKGAQAGPVTFLNDYEGFLAAAGNVRVIDFETLPDGSPSHVGVPITPEFNYTSQGVTFSSPTGDPFIGGNPVSGFDLIADGYPDQGTWITADLEPVGRAVGAFFVGSGLQLSAYDVDEGLIATVTGDFGSDPFPWFLGIVSDEPILRAILDHKTVVTGILDFAFAPVPEPLTVVFLLIGTVTLARRRPST